MNDAECPVCGASEFQELSYRFCWQPVTLGDKIEDGPTDWGSFDYGDDVAVVGVSCTSCDTTWPTYDDLAKAIKGEPHVTGQIPVTFGEVLPEPTDVNSRLSRAVEQIAAAGVTLGEMMNRALDDGRTDDARNLVEQMAVVSACRRHLGTLVH